MADISGFIKEWLGRRIDYDHVYAYQCTDLILQYVKETAGLATGVSGNAIDYWNHPTAQLLTKFNKISTTDCQQGDIVVIRGLPDNPYGHIGICVSQNSTTVTILEQNGSGINRGNGLGANAIRTRAVAKNRIAGILRPKGTPTPPPVKPKGSVFLPSSASSWAFYRVGSGLRKGTSDQIATLLPYQFPPGLTYNIEAWVGDYAVVIQSQMFGRGVIWVRGTSAQFK